MHWRRWWPDLVELGWEIVGFFGLVICLPALYSQCCAYCSLSYTTDPILNTPLLVEESILCLPQIKKNGSIFDWGLFSISYSNYLPQSHSLTTTIYSAALEVQGRRITYPNLKIQFPSQLTLWSDSCDCNTLQLWHKPRKTSGLSFFCFPPWTSGPMAPPNFPDVVASQKSFWMPIFNPQVSHGTIHPEPTG